MSAADPRHMAHALGLGRRGQGRTWPNPSVGCVIVKDGHVVGRGTTAPGGRPHAEVVALARAGEAAAGATAFVTLEPCAHHGRTPPCAEALIAARIARVVVACPDPDPRVAGRGVQMLRAAGIEVREGVMEAEARADLAGYLKVRGQGLPALTLKLATSLDGRIATATGESRWITGPAARRMVHGLRARHDAVLVGSGTARADDPDLTVRDLGVAHQPVRIVMSRRLDLSPDSRLGSTAREFPVWLLHGPDAPGPARDKWSRTGARLLEIPVAQGGLDPAAALRSLAAEGLTSVFCEGGGALAASLLQAGLVDRLVTFSAGLAIGAEGTPALGALGLDRLAEAPRFTLIETRAVGPDAMQVWSRR